MRERLRDFADLATLAQGLLALSGAGFLAIVFQAIAEAFLGLSVFERVLLGICAFLVFVAVFLSRLKVFRDQQTANKTDLERLSVDLQEAQQELDHLHKKHREIEQEREELKSENEELIVESKKLKQTSSGQADSSSSYFKNQTLHIFDLARRRTIIKDKTFEDCEIHGPAVVAPIGNTDFVDCTFAEAVDRNSLVWSPTEEERNYVGSIGLENCIFRNCNFYRIGLLTHITDEV
ncbi:hypothetical protein BH24ACT20_BH24ACT20_01110 [soil metagenome]